MEKKIITQEIRGKLREGFPDEAYSQHPTKIFLTTLKAMYVTERLNDVFGVGRWTINTEVIERTGDYILLQGEFQSLDFDVIVPKQFGGHNTTGTNTEIADGYKSALTDCQSKIASYLEIGIDLFKGKIKSNGRKAQSDINTSKYTFGNTKDEKLKWANSDNIKGMIQSISKGEKDAVIAALPLYRWSNTNKEKITKELDNNEKK